MQSQTAPPDQPRDVVSARTHGDERQPKDPRRVFGRAGEDLALTHLRNLGLSLLARNYQTRRGEIDLIMVDRDTLVFVEVKTRLAWTPRMRRRANPLEWMCPRQQTRQRRVAAAWLCDKTRPRTSTHDIRFDAIGVLLDADGRLIDLNHIEAVA
jgi:putative endonuclease